jgi:CRP-like cAMP-binding protein
VDKRPLLGEAQLAAFRRYGIESEVNTGDVLFYDGDEAYDLIIILEGRVEIVDQLGTPNENFHHRLRTAGVPR